MTDEQKTGGAGTGSALAFALPALFRRRAPEPPPPPEPERAGLPALLRLRLGAVPPPETESAQEKALSNFWEKFWTALGRVPFAEELAAAWYCWADPKTPGHVKAVLAAALAYFVVPTDLLPDFIAGLGFTDDATVLATALGMVNTHIKRRHKQAARSLLRKAEA